MSIIQGTAKSGGSASFYDFPIGDSLRFDGSSYLSRSLSSTSTFTISMWVKGSGGSNDYLFKSGSDVGLNWIAHDTDGRMYMHSANVATGYGERYRDLSAWYHLVLQSNSATARFWVNNRAATTNGSTVATRTSFTFTGTTYIGCYSTAAPNFNGYMANIQFIDGQALDPYFFGEFKDNIWVPYNAFSTAGSGTATASDNDTATDSYGTNGFHLDFADSSNIGNDVSGNNNDWTVN